VLPFANMSHDPENEYFSDGISEDIIAALGRFSGIRVMSLNAMERFKGKTPEPRMIRDQLGARYLVKGSVREADNRFRVAVELSDTDKGELLWSERYDGEGRQLFEIQDRIARSVVAALHVKLTQIEQQRVFTQPAADLEAHDLVLRARSLLYRLDRGANREARALAAKAGQLAPDYAEALVTLGEAEAQRALYGWVEEPDEAFRRASDLARRALASTDTRAHARAHGLLGMIHSNLGEYAQALDHSDRALTLNPSDAGAIHRRGASLAYTGRLEEGIAAMEEALRFQPAMNAGFAVNLVSAYYSTGRYRDALAMADLVIAGFPRDVSMRALRTAALAQLGEIEKARQEAEEVRRLNPGFEVAYFGTRFADRAHTAKLQEGLIKAGMK